MKVQTIIIWIFILIIADQAIKIIINSFFLESQFDIIPSLFEFRPSFNDKHTYVNSLIHRKFNVYIGLWPHIIMFLLIEVVFFILYSYLRNNILQRKKLLDISFIFQMAGIICALIGNLIWKNGTLDYIYLKPLFIFDLKDLYLNCFAIMFLIYFHKNKTQIKRIKMKDVVS
jgi:hypothetical protein